MLAGGHGNISVTANVAPAQMAAVVPPGAGRRRAAAASELNDLLKPLNAGPVSRGQPDSREVGPAATGLIEEGIRLPLTPLDESFHGRGDRGSGDGGNLMDLLLKPVRFVLPLLLVSFCSGCGYLFGDEGMFRDKSEDYKKVQGGPVPAGARWQGQRGAGRDVPDSSHYRQPVAGR